jgi:hypothetical protein
MTAPKLSLGPETTARLAQLGVTSIDDLRRAGAAQTWKRLKAAYPNETNVRVLFALHGALLGKPANRLTAEERAAIRAQAGLPLRAVSRPAFDYTLDYAHLDLRQRPNLYRVGKGEQGVLLVEPYKSELLPLWRFRTPDIARESAAALYQRFLAYKQAGDFVGMDMARKFLQMGYTRARRYANHRGGRKYDADEQPLPRAEDPLKAEAARIFYDAWLQARADEDYQRLKRQHQQRYG